VLQYPAAKLLNDSKVIFGANSVARYLLSTENKYEPTTVVEDLLNYEEYTLQPLLASGKPLKLSFSISLGGKCDDFHQSRRSSYMKSLDETGGRNQRRRALLPGIVCQKGKQKKECQCMLSTWE